MRLSQKPRHVLPLAASEVPLDWIDKTRQPPRLCGCKLQAGMDLRGKVCSFDVVKKLFFFFFFFFFFYKYI